MSLPPCSCAKPHPVAAGGTYHGSFTREMLDLSEEGAERLDLWTCRNCGSSRVLVARRLPEPEYPRLVACGPASARTTLRAAVWLTPRGYVGLADLTPGEAADLAPQMSVVELSQLTGLAWGAALARLGLAAVCRPARRVA